MPCKFAHSEINVKPLFASGVGTDPESLSHNAAMAGWHLREWRKQAGYTLEAFAEKVGTSAGFLSDMEKGKRRYNSDWLDRFARALDIKPGDLFRDPTTDSPDASKLPIPATIDLPIKFEVAAGAWAAVDDFRDEPFGTAEAQVLKGYEEFPQWLERVVGDSYNQKIPDGALVHVIDALAMGYAPRHGDTVIVIRRRAQGAFIERSVKEVVQTPFGTELWPRSYNPKWDQPLHYSADMAENEEAEVEIVGKVAKAYVDL